VARGLSDEEIAKALAVSGAETLPPSQETTHMQ
jgi:hypothetical protein